MYFRSSQTNRDLPMPPTPMRVSNFGRLSRLVDCTSSLAKRSSSSRPTKGGSGVEPLPEPPRCPTTRSTRHAGSGSALPLTERSSTRVNRMAFPAARCVRSPTRTVPGSAADWRRDAVFTKSPATRFWSNAPTVATASPVSTPARARRGTPNSMPSELTRSTTSSADRTARSASSS